MQKRAVAIAAAAVILLAHLISLRHETAVAHVRDTAGAIEHAHALADYHQVSNTPHLHGRDVPADAEGGSCALLAGLEQSTILADLPALTVAVAECTLAPASDVVVAPIAADVLAFAPKTSPPSLG